MNLSDINSPADLVKVNEANSVQEFVDQLDELSPQEALAVVQMLTTKLHRLHENMAARDDVSNSYIWSQDAGMLQVALDILNRIGL